MNEVFTEVFDDEDISIQPKTSSIDIDGWDSLAQIRLIVGIEQKFLISFTVDEITDLADVGEMSELILKKLSDD
tara:strand:+ start:210 stop:431 length:222 start_codon:yes stop_codon:yes gene_type:complete